MADRVKKPTRLSDLLAQTAIMPGRRLAVDKVPPEKLRARDDAYRAQMEWVEKHLSVDIAKHQLDALSLAVPAKQVRKPSLDDFSTAELVMAMLDRGYVVMKASTPGEFPDAIAGDKA